MGGLLALALGVRMYHLGWEAFWQDEIHSMYNSACARGPVERLPHGVILRDLPRYSDLTERSSLVAVWRTMDDDSHPPVYFMLLLLWRRLVGDGEAAVRFMPLVFSVLSIVPVALAVRELGLRRASPMIALILALSFCHINMAQENRPYSLSGLLVNVSFYLLVRMEQRWSTWGARSKSVHTALYGTTLFAATMNHYFAAFAFCGQLVYVLLRWRGPLLRAWLGATAAAALLFLVIWGPHVLGQRTFIASQDWLDEKLPDHAQRTVLRIVDLPIRMLFRVHRFKLSEPNALLGAGLMAATCVYLWLRRARPAVLFACWYFVPVLAFAAIDLATTRQHLTHFRYLSVALPGLAGLLGIAISDLPTRLRRGAIALFLLAAAPTVIWLPAQDNPHSRVAAGLIQSDITPNDLLVYDAVEWPRFWALRMFQMVSYYLPHNPPTVLLREQPDEALRSQIASFDRVYVISPRIDAVPNPVPQTHPHVAMSAHIFEIGWVYCCTREPPAPARR
ncbi:MAG: glycosyltransferase family 39 protein [Planctomycetota bacterium]